MPSLTTLAPFCAVVLPMWTILSTLRNLLNPASGTYTNTRRNCSEPSGTFRTLPLEPMPTRARTLRNLPKPSGTNLSEPSGTHLRNLRQHTPEPSQIFRNLPGNCFRNLHHFTAELSGTFRNLPPEPTPTYAGTIRNLPEPASGTCSCDPHRHTPEPIWAEDPISLRCWGKKHPAIWQKSSKSVFWMR